MKYKDERLWISTDTNAAWSMHVPHMETAIHAITKFWEQFIQPKDFMRQLQLFGVKKTVSFDALNLCFDDGF